MTEKTISARVACLLIFTILMTRVIYFYYSPDGTLIKIIPDDAFYYIQMAKHRIADGFWTFDGKVATTGFHLLYGYLLACIFYNFGNIEWRTLYLIIGIIASLSISISCYWTTSTVKKTINQQSIALSAAAFMTPIAIIQSTSMMESWLTLLLASATISSITKTTHKNTTVLLISIGILGSLTRSDYGLLPGMMFIACLTTDTSDNSVLTKKSMAILAGALIGIAIVTAHNLQTTSHLYQSSAEVKLFWSRIAGHNILVPINLLMFTITPFYTDTSPTLKLVFGFCTISYVVFVIFHKRSEKIPPPDSYAITLALGCALTVMGYMILYRHNSQALKTWYSGNLIIPVSYLLGMFGYYLNTRTPKAIIFLYLIYLLNGITNLFSTPWPGQTAMMETGIYLKNFQSDAVFASWNAGIYSYFSNRPLINLDGLANDEVLYYIKHNSLSTYIRKRNIRYIVDCQAMLSNKTIQARGGYQDNSFLKCLNPVYTTHSDINNTAQSPAIFEILPHCG